MKMNLPNKLTVMRLCMVPLILVALLLPENAVTSAVSLFLFCAASITDFFDGKIARKRNLITDFGKFLDPLADKFMVIAAIFGIVCRAFRAQNRLLFWVFMAMLIVTIFRELAVASIRLVASTSGGVVVAANLLGKIKTVTQMACVILALAESIVQELIPDYALYGYYPAGCSVAAVAVIFTVLSGINYLASCWKYLDPEK